MPTSTILHQQCRVKEQNSEVPDKLPQAELPQFVEHMRELFMEQPCLQAVHAVKKYEPGNEAILSMHSFAINSIRGPRVWEAWIMHTDIGTGMYYWKRHKRGQLTEHEMHMYSVH